MKNDRLEVRPLDYDTKLTFEEAEERLREVEKVFNLVKRRYSGIFGSRKTEISKGDNEALGKCTGVLLPLGMNPVVQKEVLKAENLPDNLNAKIASLIQEIMLFLGRFVNSGIEILEGGPGFF